MTANLEPGAHESESAGTAMDWPPVTVIVPVRNGARFIVACLQALLAQDYPGPAPELIVVDNGSSDGTGELVRAHGDSVILLQESRRGASCARNAGIRRASHELLAFTDADCVPRPDWLRELVAAARLHPEAAFVGGPILALRPTNSIGLFAESLFDHERAMLQSKPPGIITANVLARRSQLLRFGLFNPAFQRGQDTELALRAYLSHGARFAFTRKAVVEHVNVSSLAGLWQKGLQHGRGAALLWRSFETHLGRSRRDRLRDPQPFRDAYRETVALLPWLWRHRHDWRGHPHRLDSFYNAVFRLARHLGFIYHSLIPD